MPGGDVEVNCTIDRAASDRGVGRGIGRADLIDLRFELRECAAVGSADHLCRRKEVRPHIEIVLGEWTEEGVAVTGKRVF